MQSVKTIQQKSIINKNKKSKPHIAISEENYKKLKSLGSMGSTFDEVLSSILAKEVGVHKINV